MTPVVWHVVDGYFPPVIVSPYFVVAEETLNSWHLLLFDLVYSISGLDSRQISKR